MATRYEQRGDRRGISAVEVIVAVVCIVVILVVAITFVVPSRRHSGRQILKERVTIQQIHRSWVTFAGGNEGRFPTPGLVRRLPDPKLGERVPGVGPEDVSANTTANVYSVCIMQNYFPPNMTVGPTEPSPRVLPDEDYDWEAYDPVGGVHWDDGFVADLDVESNVSFAHLPIFGMRATRFWRNVEAPAPGMVILGNRGPRGGVEDRSSITYRIHGSPRRWSGIVALADNSTELVFSFTPFGDDNIFASGDDAEGADSFITFTKAMTAEGPVIQHD